ncbi:MAG: oligosaccharide flippase family protein [Ekhidna sp.]|nr:oligosaccharide flippase family protein [Ekhidna sp.]
MFQRLLEKLRKLFKEKSFFSSILILLTGNGLAQLIGLIIAPLLARLYSPEDFGIFGFFSGLVAILAILSTLKLDQAVIIAPKDEDFDLLMVLGLLSAAAFCSLALVVLFPFSVGFVELKSEYSYFYWFPLLFILFGVIQQSISLYTRKKQFGRISKSRVIKGLSTAALSIGFFYVGSINGLILAVVVGTALQCFYLFYGELKYFKHLGRLIPSLTRSLLRATIADYKKFPFFSAPSTLINTLSLYIPAILFPFLFSEAESGYYFQSFKLLIMPMSLIGASYGQAFFQRASEVNLKEGSIGDFVFKNLKVLLGLGNVFFIPLFLFGESLFVLILGEDWEISGKISEIIAIWISLTLTSSSMHSITSVLQKQELSLYYNIVAVSARLATIFITYYVLNDFMSTVIILTGVNAVLTISFIITLLHTSGIKIRKTLQLFFLAVILPFTALLCFKLLYI